MLSNIACLDNCKRRQRSVKALRKFTTLDAPVTQISGLYTHRTIVPKPQPKSAAIDLDLNAASVGMVSKLDGLSYALGKRPKKNIMQAPVDHPLRQISTSNIAVNIRRSQVAPSQLKDYKELLDKTTQRRVFNN